MPIYAYRCNECGHEFEKRQRMLDDPLRDCPQCEGTVRRVVNSVGVVFKGSGFYITDTRNGKSTTLPATSDSKSDSSDTGSKSESTDSKTTSTQSSPATSTGGGTAAGASA